jgi:putative membrane protein
VNRKAQGIVLLLVGGGVLRASLTDLYLRYVKAGLRPLLIAAGITLIIAALATFWYEWRSARASHDHDHDHPHHEPKVAWLLLLPLFALILVAPQALGSYSADRMGTTLQPQTDFPRLPPGDPLAIPLHDYAARAVYDHGRSLTGLHIRITGFYTAGHQGPILTRMVFNCCAADAQPVKVGLSGQLPPGGLPDGTWIEVLGTYTSKQIKDDINGGPIPYIDVSQLQKVAIPRFQYEI